MYEQDPVTATATPEAPAAGDAQQQPKEVPQAEGQEPPQSESATDKPDEGKDDKDTPDKVQRRFNRLTREKYEARARAEALEREVAQLRQLMQGQSKTDDGQQGQQVLSPEEEQERIARQAREIVERERMQSAVSAVLQTGSKEFPDFVEAFENLRTAPVQIPRSLVFEIAESPAAAALIYYLGNNLDEADALGRMAVENPFKAARELRKLEERLSKPKTSAAPKPLSPIRGAAPDDVDPEKLSDAEWVKRRRQSTKD